MVFSLAGIKGTGITYLSEFHCARRRPKYVSFLGSFTSCADVLQPLVGLLIMTRAFEWNLFGVFVYKPWRIFIFINSLVAGLASIGLCLLPESPKFLLAMGKQEEAIQALGRMYASNKKMSKEVSFNSINQQF